ncbi:MAG TPA: TonB-dependent receptor [Amphiplicatus sp.]|nr:TonB-dependent receptor [Amphiplicatus sp.]
MPTLNGRAALLCNASFAVLLFASAPSAAVAQVSPATEEIVVTARKRAESIQDAPLSIQAFDGQKVDELNLNSFEDYVRFTPSVSFVSEGPGQSSVVIRGVTDSTGASFSTIQSSAGLYLDEQPITVNGASPDPRLVDIERIEVLPGPQGSLYGASSQSGTVRIITNKPDPTQTEGYIEATGKSLLKEGEESYDFNGALNIPLIQDKLAFRITGFAVRDGGYIDNVLGTTSGGTVDNADVVEDDVNSATYYGGRTALRYLVNDDWTVTAAYLFQDVNVHGRSDYDPDVGDLEAVRFFKEYYNDQFQQGALTIEGDAGVADFVLATAYFNRKTAYLNDNTAYDQYLSAVSAYYPLYDFGPDPTGFNDGGTTDERITIEARLSSHYEASRWSWILGAFYERGNSTFAVDSNVTDFPLTPGFATAQSYLPTLEPTDVYFYQTGDYHREQFALFGELTYELTDRLSVTAGGRWFTANSDGVLHTELPFGATETIVDADLPIVTFEDSNLTSDEKDFLPKANVTWKATDDLLFYFTYSQGYRLGGGNRQRLGLAVPAQYSADILTNYEFGWKSEWFDKALTLNGAAFYMKWDDFQSSIRNPDPTTYFYVIANVGQARIYGVEGELVVRPTDALEIGGSFTVLDAELSEPSALLSGDVSSPIPKGARLPVSPKFKGALYAQYTVPLPSLGGEAYVRGDYSYTGESVNSIDPSIADIQHSYEIADFQLGFKREDWSVNFFLNNAFDERAELFVNPNFVSVRRITPNRPREIGVTLRKQF